MCSLKFKTTKNNEYLYKGNVQKIDLKIYFRLKILKIRLEGIHTIKFTAFLREENQEFIKKSTSYSRKLQSEIIC